jgi:hypothetical protein
MFGIDKSLEEKSDGDFKRFYMIIVIIKSQKSQKS